MEQGASRYDTLTPDADWVTMISTPRPSISLLPPPPIQVREIARALKALRYIAARNVNLQMEIYQFDLDELPMPVFDSDRNQLTLLDYQDVPMDPTSKDSPHWVKRRGSNHFVISQEAQEIVFTKILTPLSRLRNPKPSNPFVKGEKEELRDRIFAAMAELVAEIMKRIPNEYTQAQTDVITANVRALVKQDMWDYYLRAPYGFTWREFVPLPM